MPIYEYECPKCGKFEEIQKMTDKQLETCPKCGNPCKRLISKTDFVLLGGGWYKDGYQKIKS
jgi:putative FmdB family regulatory protein